MAIALPAHLPGIILAPGSKLVGRLRNVFTEDGPFSVYLRVRTGIGGSGTLFRNAPFVASANGPNYSAGGLSASGTPGKIQHLVFVRSNGGACQLYLDNAAVASGTYGASLDAETFEVGPWQGRIYRVCFWNRALSAEDVASLPSHGPADQDRWGSRTFIITT